MDINYKLPYGKQSRSYKRVDNPSEHRIEITCNLIKRASNGDQAALMVLNSFGIQSVLDARGNVKNRNRILTEIAIAKEIAGQRDVAQEVSNG